MRALLDTVAFLWAIDSPELISRAAASVLADESALLEISAISISEIAVKRARGKLDFSRADVEQGIADLRVRVLPYAAEHSFRLFELPLHHTDPFDRQIIAQAMAEDIPVVTSDRIFGAYQGLKIIW
ncbi:MAG TPA: type II toxin-antitoxin system VapC family toxin [Candidatus Binatus sp.]|nr:type II toxin-antitoxin system VapC family toxin [Candidatus Binatus sp.]